MVLFRLVCILLPLTLTGIFHLNAQSLTPSVLTSAGNQGSDQEGHQLSWTLGETAILHLSNGALNLTQGFHQPELEPVSSVFNYDNQRISIQLFPNPAANQIYLLPSTEDQFTYRITTIRGEVLQTIVHTSGRTQIGLDPLPAGLYLVQVWLADHVLGHIKFVKSR